MGWGGVLGLGRGELAMGPARWGLGAGVLAGQRRVGGTERVHSWQSQPTHVRRGLSELDPPASPCPFCAPSPKALSSLPLSLHGDPGAFPVSLAAAGPLGEPSPLPRPPEGSGPSRRYREGTRTPQPLWPQPLLCPPSSQHEGDLPGALAAQQAEEQSAAPRCQYAEAGEPPAPGPLPPWKSHPPPTPCPGWGEAHGCHTVVC